MNDSNLVASSLHLKSRLVLCYLGIMVAIGMAATALGAIYSTHLPVLRQTSVANSESNHANTAPLALPNEQLAKSQALNLAYVAEINFKLGYKERAQQILESLPKLLGDKDLKELQALTLQVKNYSALDKAKLRRSLDSLKDYYETQLADGKFGQRTIAQVVKVQEQDFIHKQHQFLEEVERLEMLIASENYVNLASNIDNLIKASNELDASLFEKAQELNEFKERNTVSFEELLIALSEKTGNE